MGSEAPPSPSPSPSALWLAVRVLDEPAQVFSALARRPRALVPIVLFVIVTLGVSFGAPASLLRRATEQQLNALEQRRPGILSPEARDRAIARSGGLASRASTFVAATLVALIVAASVAGVLTLIFDGANGAEVGFRDEWGIAWHAYTPQTIGFLVTWIGIALTDDLQFRVGLGFLVPEEASRFLHNFAQQFTFFGAWNAYLLALGNQIKTQTRTIGGALGIVGGLWVVANLIFAGLATMLAGLMGG